MQQGVRLASLLAEVPVLEVRGDAGVRVTGISYDSRDVRPGHLFVALEGVHTDGHRFVGDALERGATAVLHARAIGQAAIGDQHQFDFSDQTEVGHHPSNQFDHLWEGPGTGRLAIARQRDVVQSPCAFGHAGMHEVALEDVGKHRAQLGFELRQVDFRRGAAHQIRHLAIHAGPVAGVIGVEVDAHRYTSGTP